MEKIKGGSARLLSGLVQPFKFIGRIIAVAWWPIALLWRSLRWLMRALFGRLNYEAPVWYTAGSRALRHAGGYLMRTSRAWLLKDRRRAVGALAVVIVVLLAGVWYAVQPKPSEATFTISSPARTRSEDPKAKPDPVTVTFSQAVAPIDRISTEGIAKYAMATQAGGMWGRVNNGRFQFMTRNGWEGGAGVTGKG